MAVAWVLVTAIVVLMLLGVPVSLSLIGAAMVATLWVGGIDLMIIPQQLFIGIDNALLIAIPLFLLAGGLMTAGGMTTRLRDFAYALFGRFRGGLALSNVASATFMAGVSGSPVADTTALGRVLIPVMVRQGYSPAFSAAVTAAANVVGPLLPPSITFVIIGALTHLSVTRLFLAGVLPGILYSAAMLLTAWLISRTRRYPVYGRSSSAEIWRTFRGASWALLMPLLIVLAIRTRVLNVAECSAVAVLYALVVVVSTNRGLKPGVICRTLVQTARTTAVIILVIGGAQTVSWFFAQHDIPQQIASWVLATSAEPLLFLLLVNVLLFVIGTFLENGPAVVLLSPLLYPIAAKLGIDPIHFSMVISLNLVLGLITPPAAMSLSITSLIARVPASAAMREALPFVAAALVVLVCVTLRPEISLWLPDLLMGKG